MFYRSDLVSTATSCVGYKPSTSDMNDHVVFLHTATHDNSERRHVPVIFVVFPQQNASLSLQSLHLICFSFGHTAYTHTLTRTDMEGHQHIRAKDKNRNIAKNKGMQTVQILGRRML